MGEGGGGRGQLKSVHDSLMDHFWSAIFRHGHNWHNDNGEPINSRTPINLEPNIISAWLEGNRKIVNTI